MSNMDDEWANFRRNVWNPSQEDKIHEDEADLEEIEHTEVWTPEESEDALPEDYTLLWLAVKEPIDRRGTIISIPPEGILGRGRDADVRWDDPRMSRRHARFTLEPDPEEDNTNSVYFLWPQEARNGVFYNGKQLRGAQRLHENDVIQMGDTIFVVKLLD